MRSEGGDHTKKEYAHDETLAGMTDDDRSGISDHDWYGEDVPGVFEKHHLHFRDVFERIQTQFCFVIVFFASANYYVEALP